jgi:hypothetical protein
MQGFRFGRPVPAEEITERVMAVQSVAKALAS